MSVTIERVCVCVNSSRYARDDYYDDDDMMIMVVDVDVNGGR